MKAAGKRLVFDVLLVAIVLLGIEAGSHLLFFAHKGYFLFQQRPSEVFNLRDFAVVTHDARGFTAIPNYTNKNYRSVVSGFDAFRPLDWFLSFDAFGFRGGKQTASAAGQPQVVFIGDSVPFGWGVSDHGSLPSQFFEHLQAHSLAFGVINAALPSYALAQAVARYEHEIHSRMAVDTVYLQIYDPASQLATRGARWQPSDNWMNFPYVSKSFLARHSATAVLVGGGLARFHSAFGSANSLTETFAPADTVTTKRVQVHVRAELERLLALSQADGVRHVVVAPITIPASSLQGHYSRSRLSAIELVNQGLRAFASAYPDKVLFADTIRLLRSSPEADVFIDRCCHVSERGNGLVADYLLTLLRNVGHFSRPQL
jgi:hypothetical protein